MRRATRSPNVAPVPRVLLAVAAAALLCLLFATAAAQAATRVSVSGEVVTLTADNGVAHQIDVSASAGTVHIADAADTVVAGPGCVSAGGGADCTAAGPVVATLGDGNDVFSAAGSPAGVRVDGGAGDDTITGSPYDDALTGGAGADTISGLAGRDDIHTADGAADTVDCGAGSADLADADVGDALTACEETPATASLPDTSLDSGPPAVTKQTSATVSMTATAAGSFECSLDGAAYAACASPATFAGLADGRHSLLVRALDGSSSPDPTPAVATWTVDTQPPGVSIGTAPASPANSASAHLAFSVDEPATVVCRLDGGAWSSCASPVDETGLAEGSHTFEVRATDAAGNVGSASTTWTVDLTAPGVGFNTAPPAATPLTSAAFAFSVDDATATVECRIDGGSFAPCASPLSFTGLAEGSHTVTVRATDAAGNVGTAAFSWSVDLTAPHVAFASTPAGLSNDAAPRFAFTTTETANVACRVDGGAWTICASTTTFPGLGDGQHTLTVHATDPAGNTGPDASYTWTIDTLRPQTQLTAGPPTSAPVNSSDATFSFASPDGVGFDCRLDGAAWEPCATPKTYSGLPNGAHRFDVRAVDAAGNVDGTPATRAWTVAVDGRPTAAITVTRDATGFTLSGLSSSDPEGAGLQYRWTVDGAAAGTTPTIHYDQPDAAGRDDVLLVVTDGAGQQGQASVAFTTTKVAEPAGFERFEIVPFAGGTRLTADGRRRLRSLRGAVAGAKEISIVGYSHAGGSARTVARQRAQAIRRALLAGKRTRATLSVTSAGASHPAATDATPDGRARNDRVTVSIRSQSAAERLVTQLAGDPSIRMSTGGGTASAATGRVPKLFAFWARNGSVGLRRLAEIGSRVTVLAPNFYDLDETSGDIRGAAPDPKVMALSHRLGFSVWPVVNASMASSTLIDSPAGRTKVIRNISGLADQYNMSGVTLDMEEMAPDQQGEFTALVKGLATALHAHGRKLAVYAVRRTTARVNDSAAAYDWPALASAADLLIGSGYDEHGTGTGPGPVTTAQGFSDLLSYATSVSRTKVAPAIASFGWRWHGSGDPQLIASEQAERRWPVASEIGDASEHVVKRGGDTIYYESAANMWAREQAVRRAGTAWIALFSLGREPERFWERSALR